jgi:hypothetical protein
LGLPLKRGCFRVQFGKDDSKVRGGMTQQAQVLGPLECKVASKLIRQSTHIGKEAATTQRGTTRPLEGGTVMKPDFKLKGELLYEGQGKDNTIVNNNSYSHTTKSTEEGQINTQGMEGLQPPCLEESGDIIHGETKALMQKEKKSGSKNSRSFRL